MVETNATRFLVPMQSHSFKTDFDPLEVARRTRHLIIGSGLSVSEVSRLTRARYGAESSYFIADTFISKIRKGVSPHLCQIAALSEVTCCPFADLMQHFGFDLRQITRLQIKLLVDRTVLVKPNESFTVPYSDYSRYLYAKIGRQDGMAFPEIMPGSIVRIDTSQTSGVSTSKANGRRPLYVVDHLRGLSCCYVTAVNDTEILLTPHYLPYGCLQLRLGEQARILGVVDAELRPSQGIEIPNPAVSDGFERRVPIPAMEAPQRVSQLLRNSRERVGLHFRQARDLTARVGQELGNDEYAIALGTLSDYEAVDAVPRHVSKIISLCIVYAIDFAGYLRSAGIALNPSAQRALAEINPELRPISLSSLHTKETNSDGSHFSQSYFPRSLIDAQSELLRGKSDSLETYAVHPGDRSSEAKLFIVDRCSTQLEQSAWPAAWQRPVYVVRKRDGRYVYGFCTVTDGVLTVHHDPTMTRVVERFYRKEVDVVGQVVTMLRSIG